jgi:hypothetical protein
VGRGEREREREREEGRRRDLNFQVVYFYRVRRTELLPILVEEGRGRRAEGEQTEERGRTNFYQRCTFIVSGEQSYFQYLWKREGRGQGRGKEDGGKREGRGKEEGGQKEGRGREEERKIEGRREGRGKEDRG